MILTHPHRIDAPLAPMPQILQIGGSDSSGGAGLMLDQRVCAGLGVEARFIVSMITSQNHHSASGFFSTPVGELARQWQSLLPFWGKELVIKLGAIGKEGLVFLSEQLRIENGKGKKIKLVCDPVLSTSSGASFWSSDELNFLRRELLPLVDVLTPNWPEAQQFWGRPLTHLEQVPEAARALLAMGVKAVLIKGGHAPVGKEEGTHQTWDYFATAEKSFWVGNSSVSFPSVSNCRGTGCALASALACGLALNLPVEEALILAKMILHQGLRTSRIDHGGQGRVLGNLVFSPQSEDLPQVRKTLPLGGSFLGPPPFASHLSNHFGCSLYPVVESAQWVAKLLPASPPMIQLRIKNLRGEELRGEVQRAQALTRSTGTLLVLNDYWDLALELGVKAIHLGQEDLQRAPLEQLAASGIQLGVSTHNYFEAACARALCPSYVALGPIYPTELKAMPFAPQGLSVLSVWRRLFSIPLVAIGGLNLSRAQKVSATGADYIAVVRDLTLSPDPLRRAFKWRQALSVPPR